MTHSSFKIFSSVASVADPFSGVLLDAYGVFWGGNECGALPGSCKAMEELVQGGKIVGILSNTTQLAAVEIKKFHHHGLLQGKHFHFVVTSGDVVREVFLSESLPFKTPRKTFCLFGGVHPRFASHQAIIEGSNYREVSDINQADFIYISIPHLKGEDQTDPDLFREELELLKAKDLPMLCPNPDRFAHEGKPPRAVVRQGSIAKLYEEMGGDVFYIGKPHNQVYAKALKRFGQHNIIDRQNILMVGDTPETDIKGARLFCMHAALVIKTGIMADRVAYKGMEKAFHDLPASERPDFYIETL